MTDVDILSSPKWPSIVEALQLAKSLNEIQTEDVVGKVIDSINQSEVFYRIYTKWMGSALELMMLSVEEI